MAARNSNAAGRRSWRDAPAPQRGAPGPPSKWPLRIFFAVAVVSLIGCLVWLLSQPGTDEPSTHFVALTTGKMDLLSLPPILFEQNTVAPLREFDDLHNEFNFNDGEQAQRSANASKIEALLSGLKANERDRLVVYVSAHGVSADGEAYILGPGYDVREPDKNRYPAAELVRLVSAQNVATKLIVFDCSRVAAIPRIGMLSNEFFSLVAQAARECQDENLWIATAASDYETSPLGIAQKQSVVGSGLAKGLTGAADGAKGEAADRDITIGELKEFMKAYCAAAPVAAPTPKFVFCGASGEPSVSESPVLLRLYPKEEAGDSESSAAQAAESADSEQQDENTKADTKDEPPNDDRDENVANGTPQARPAKEEESAEAAELAEGNQSPASGKANVVQSGAPQEQQVTGAANGAKNPSTIMQAWQLRDQLEQQPAKDPRAALPFDYAPHYWNELSARLVALHLRHLDQEKNAEIEEMLGVLKQLGNATDTSRRRFSADGIIAARSAYQNSSQWKELESLAPDYAELTLFIRRAILQVNRFVQWHRAAHSSTVGGASQFTGNIARLLVELSELDRQIAGLETSVRISDPDFRKLAQARRRIADQLTSLQRGIAALVPPTAENGTPAAQRRREIVLSTALATREQREAALPSQRARQEKPNDQSAPDHRAALDHLRLECLLLLLVDPDNEWSKQFTEIANNQNRPRNEEEARQLHRKLGTEIKAYYADLPTRIEQLLANRIQKSDQRAAEKMITVLHPQDTSKLGNGSLRLAGFITPRLRPPAIVSLTDPALVPVSNRWRSVSWKLEAKNTEIESARLKIGSFDDTNLEVRYPAIEKTLRTGDVVTLPSTSLSEISLQVRLAADWEVQSSNALDLPITVVLLAADGQTYSPSGTAALLPSPHRIDLFAWCVEPEILPGVEAGTGEANFASLRPFPNRTTTFRFALANYAAVKKNLKFELYGVPRRKDHNWPPGLLLNEKDEPPSQLLKLWEAGDFGEPLAIAEVPGLPADKQRHQIQLQPPGGSQEQPKEPGDQAPAEGDPTPPAPAAPADITSGLVARIVDLDGESPDILKWIEITTRRPQNYLSFPTEYNERGRILRFETKPIDLNRDARPDLPPLVAETPVLVKFYGEKPLVESEEAEPSAILTTPDRSKFIDVQLSTSATGRHTFGLNVDQVPRACLWELDFESDALTALNDSTNLQIDWIGMPGDEDSGIESRLFRTRDSSAFPKVDEKAWPAFRRMRLPVCAFNVRGGARPLKLRLRVDAPRNAFNSLDGKDVLQLKWRGAAVPLQRIYADRAIRCSLAEITEQGELSLATTVDDIEVSLDATSTQDLNEYLDVELRLGGTPVAERSLKIAFDGKPPIVKAVFLEPSSVVVGRTKRVTARVAVNDLSDVERIEAWLVPELPADEKELDPKAATHVQAFGDHRARVSKIYPLTLDAPLEPKPHFLVLRVTDRSGQTANTLDKPATLMVREPPPPPKPGPVIHDIIGTVTLREKPGISGLTVKLLEGKKVLQTTTTKSRGKFTFKQIKASTYTFVVEGTAGSSTVKAEEERELAKKADYAVTIATEPSINLTPSD